MAKLPDQFVESPTVLAIFAAYERDVERRQSRRLGASIVGKECGRAIWFDFRWAGQEAFDGRMLRLFQTGQMEEMRIVGNLRAIGCEVHFPAEGNPEQFEFTDIGGHLVCKIDAAAVGLPEAAKAWHCCEFKTHNAKSFAAVRAQGLKKAKPQHYAQLIVGMKLSGMTRGLYLAKNKDDDSLYAERLRWEEVKDDAERVLAWAKTIIESDRPPERISNDRDDFRCKFCHHADRCHGSSIIAVPVDVTCRTCLHATPVVGESSLGAWRCDKHGKTLDEFAQKKACQDHLFIPDLVTFAKYEDAGEGPDGDWVEYRNADGSTWRSGKQGNQYRSVELTVLAPADVGSAHSDKLTVHAIKQEIGGLVVSGVPG